MILAFYSYKGGVGRTSLALDVAARLSLGGPGRLPLRVLVWDLDLDAPGVRHFEALAPLVEQAKCGTHDLLALARAEEGDADRLVDADEVHALLKRAVVTHPTVADGRLGLILPAGRDSPEFASDTAQHFGAEGQGAALLALGCDVVRERLEYDVIVLDARTGVNDLAATATNVLADSAVLVFRLDGQDVAHVGDISRSIQASWEEQGPSAANRLYRAASLVPEAAGSDMVDQLERRRRELDEQRLSPNVEISLRPMSLIRESVPSLEGSEATSDEGTERLAEWAFERWAEYAGRPRAAESGSTSGRGRVPQSRVTLIDEIEELLQIGQWDVARGVRAGDQTFELVASRIEFGQRRSVAVKASERKRGPEPGEVLAFADSASLAEVDLSAKLQTMMVAEQFSSGTRRAAGVRNVVLATPTMLLDELAPLERLFRQARQRWDGSITERRYVPAAGRAVVHVGSTKRPTGEFPLEAELLENIIGQKTGLQLVLGEFGSGKTTLCLGLARRLADAEVAPLSVELRDTDSESRTLDDLITRALRGAGISNLGLDAWRAQISRGRVALLVDGFDEFVSYADQEAAGRLIEDLSRYATKGHVVLTSRWWPFRHEADRPPTTFGPVPSVGRYTSLWKQIQAHSVVRASEVQPFDNGRIQEYLRNRFGGSAPDLNEGGLASVIEMMRRPYLLTLVVASLDRWEERGWPEKVTLTSVYEGYLASWLDDELLVVDGRPLAVASLAVAIAGAMLRAGDKLMPAEFRRVITAWATERTSSRPSAEERMSIERKIRSASFIVRDESGRYLFAHRSFLDFFLALGIARAVRSAQASELISALDVPALTPEALTFLEAWPNAWEMASGACRAILTRPVAVKSSSANALLLFVAQERQRIGLKGPIAIAGSSHLEGVNLGGADLSNVVLDHARMTGASLSGANLRGASLRAAEFSGASFDNAIVCNADLSDALGRRADFSGADLAGCDLRSSVLAESTFDRASLERALLDEADLTGASLHDAAMSNASMMDTSLVGAQLSGVVADDVDMGTADLTDADVRFARLRSGTADISLASADIGVRAGDLDAGISNYPCSVPALNAPRCLVHVEVAGSPRLAIGGFDGRITLWDPAADATESMVVGHEAPICAIAALEDDGAWCLLSSAGGDLIRTDLADGESTLLDLDFGSSVQAILAVPGSGRSWIATGHRDGTVAMWDSETLSVLWLVSVAGDGDITEMATFASDGETYICVLAGDQLRAFDAWGVARPDLSVGSVGAISAARHGVMALTGEDTIVTVTARGTNRRQTPPQAADVAALAGLVLGEEEFVYLGASDGVTTVIRPDGDVRRSTSEGASVVQLTLLCPIADPALLAVLGGDGSVRILDALNLRELRVLKPQTDIINALSLDSERRMLITAGEDGSVRMWDMDGLRQERCVDTTPASIQRDICLVPGPASQGTRLASLSGFGDVQIVDLESGSESAVGESDLWISCVAGVFDAGRGLVACGTEEGTVLVVNALEGRIEERLESGVAGVSDLVWCRSGRALLIAAVDDEGGLSLLDARNSRAVHGAFSAPMLLGTVGGEKNQLLVTSLDQEIAVRDPFTRLTEVASIRCDSAVTCLGASSSSYPQVFAAGFADGSIGIYELEDGRLSGETWQVHGSWVKSVAIFAAPGMGPQVVSASEDGTVRVTAMDGSGVRIAATLAGTSDWVSFSPGPIRGAGIIGSTRGLDELILVNGRWSGRDVAYKHPELLTGA